MTPLQIYAMTLALMSAPPDLPPPVVEILPAGSIPGRVGEYVDGTVRAEDDRCIELTLVHEFSHSIAIRTGRLAGVPNQKVKARLEQIARDVERRWPRFMPNCQTDTTP